MLTDDYVIKLIDEIISMMQLLIFGDEDNLYTLPEDEQLYGDADYTYRRAVSLCDGGDINGGENLLFEELDFNDVSGLDMSLGFYRHINGYSDEFLENAGYDRCEIKDGLRSIAKGYDLLEAVEVLLQ